MWKSIGFLSVVTLFFGSCGVFSGEEVGRMSFTSLSNDSLELKEVDLVLKSGEEVSFWSEVDLDYEGDLQLQYTIELWSDSTKVGGFYLNALETNPTMLEVRTKVGNRTSWRFKGKMDYLRIEEDGAYTFKGVIKSNETAALKMNKADLILTK